MTANDNHGVDTREAAEYLLAIVMRDGQRAYVVSNGGLVLDANEARKRTALLTKSQADMVCAYMRHCRHECFPCRV